ncbi:cytidine deaminase [Motilibacter aurantiacus]|uniref:cytidine deaminase n=1 Tax=Motilibacter aurantiacus TaxID=2714955 RepID=UPI001409B9E9|nr:cytidine deaminase [Motilibacter aurantiacus]NHC43918.1 cytidine deaminase [Motilibacter aurantiacus]
MSDTPPVDWDALRAAAVQAAGRAYAPYSRFPVGAAGLVDDGRVVSGCNVENASYGVGLCAECGLVTALHNSGGGRLVAVVAVGGHGQLLSPCGRCRQLLLEAGGRSCRILLESGEYTIDGILPYGFDDADLRAEWEASRGTQA